MLYAGEGESRKPGVDGTSPLDVSAVGAAAAAALTPGTHNLKGHEFCSISFHMPTVCELCQRNLWSMFKPPPAMECRSEYNIIICKISYKKININYLQSKKNTEKLFTKIIIYKNYYLQKLLLFYKEN